MQRCVKKHRVSADDGGLCIKKETRKEVQKEKRGWDVDDDNDDGSLTVLSLLLLLLLIRVGSQLVDDDGSRGRSRSRSSCCCGLLPPLGVASKRLGRRSFRAAWTTCFNGKLVHQSGKGGFRNGSFRSCCSSRPFRRLHRRARRLRRLRLDKLSVPTEDKVVASDLLLLLLLAVTCCS